MNSIKVNFQKIVDVQKRIGYYFPSVLNNPADLNSIDNTQQKLDLEFSKELIELYLCANGSKESDKPLGLIGLTPAYVFMDLASAENYYSTYIQFGEQFKIWDSGFTPGVKLFPFLEDSSGDCYWLDLNKGTDNYGKIFWTNTYPDSPSYQFNSLTSMFETIAQAYEKGIYFLDPDNLLDKNYDQFGKLAEKLNPGIPFWVNYNQGA